MCRFAPPRGAKYDYCSLGAAASSRSFCLAERTYGAVSWLLSRAFVALQNRRCDVKQGFDHKPFAVIEVEIWRLQLHPGGARSYYQLYLEVRLPRHSQRYFECRRWMMIRKSPFRESLY